MPLALPGAKLPGDFTIKESKLRGELSQGMLCSAKELALAEDAEGLLILPADAPVGKIFSEYHAGRHASSRSRSPPTAPTCFPIAASRAKSPPSARARSRSARRQRSHFPRTTPAWTAQLSAPDLGPYYTATHLTDVKVGPSPAWLQEAIASTGHRPINNVVDITNYVLFETGQPLHAFDAGKLAGHDHRSAPRPRGRKARGARRQDLRSCCPTISSSPTSSGPVAIAGVMGGKPTGVTESTTEIVLEAAWFLPATVRRTSRRLGLISDSSYRYERRVDPGALARGARSRACAAHRTDRRDHLLARRPSPARRPSARGPITLRAQADRRACSASRFPSTPSSKI